MHSPHAAHGRRAAGTPAVSYGPAGRASAAGRQRRKIERDLHDGAQQHVPAQRLELMLSPPSPAGAALVEHVEEALEALQNVL
jgi:hypothetical protein